jgi:hypothetical protein
MEFLETEAASPLVSSTPTAILRLKDLGSMERLEENNVFSA